MFSIMFIKRPILATVCSIVIVITGIVSIYTLPIAQFPELVPPQVTVSAQYPGATPEVIAQVVAAPLETQSHGQGFLDFFQSRLMPGGLYLMDEPEAALSYVNQLALIYLMQDAVSDGCQFVLATHSPILTACPGAAIYEIDEGRLTPTDYEHLSSVQFLSHFLKAHAHLLGAE